MLKEIDGEGVMRDWSYDNEQWIKLPNHLRHLPIFTRHFDLFSLVLRFLWFVFLKFLFFRFYIRLEVKGDFAAVKKQHPKLLVVSNHASHLDAISISTSIPFRFWMDLYFAAAKDYFFSGFWMTFFSKHCIGAIPIDRKDRKGEGVKLCTTLLDKLDSIWLVMFPEGTRSKDGFIHPFKKGISVFSLRSKTSILFLYLEGAYDLWPKDAGFAHPGRLVMHVGPVHPPAPVEQVFAAYKNWVESIHPGAFAPDEIQPSMDSTPSATQTE